MRVGGGAGAAGGAGAGGDRRPRRRAGVIDAVARFRRRGRTGGDWLDRRAWVGSTAGQMRSRSTDPAAERRRGEQENDGIRCAQT